MLSDHFHNHNWNAVITSCFFFFSSLGGLAVSFPGSGTWTFIAFSLLEIIKTKHLTDLWKRDDQNLLPSSGFHTLFWTFCLHYYPYLSEPVEKDLGSKRNSTVLHDGAQVSQKEHDLNFLRFKELFDCRTRVRSSVPKGYNLSLVELGIASTVKLCCGHSRIKFSDSSLQLSAGKWIEAKRFSPHL